MNQDQDSQIRRTPPAQATFAGFRRFDRATFQTDVLIQDRTGWEIPLESVNVSPTGIFIRSDFLFEVGEEHTIIFRMPQDGSWLRVPGRVVRVEGALQQPEVGFDEESVAGMAFEFLRADAETLERLQQMIVSDLGL
jgi:hypothetical protein